MKKAMRIQEPEVTNLVKMQPHALLPMSEDGRKRYHKSQRNTWGRQLTFKPLPVIHVPHNDIDSVEKIIHCIRENYGWLVNTYDDEHPETITYLVFFRGQRNNKKHNNKVRKVIQYYDKNFLCDGDNCRYFNHCRIKHLAKRGWSCAKNPKYIWTWVLRLKFILKRNPTKEPPYDYKYHIIRNSTSRLKWIQKAKKTEIIHKEQSYESESSYEDEPDSEDEDDTTGKMESDY